MRLKGKRIVLNIGSALTIAPKASSPIYCGSKAGLRVLSRSLGYQLAEAGVSVTHAMLPLVDTPMTAGRGEGKLSPEMAASKLIEALESESVEVGIGKAKLLGRLYRLWPGLAYRILRNE